VPDDAPSSADRGGRSLRQLTPLDPPMVPFALIGMAVWLVLALVSLIFRSTLEANGHGDWLGICVAGFLLGIPGLLLMMGHDARRRRRRAGPPEKSTRTA
jgi:predicted membrane protein